MRRLALLGLLGLLGLLALSACATQPLATATVGPITGATVTIGADKPPVAIVKTIKVDCEPPAQLLTKHGPLPLIAQDTLTQSQALHIWLDDLAAFQDLRVDDSALIDWVRSNCQGQ